MPLEKASYRAKPNISGEAGILYTLGKGRGRFLLNNNSVVSLGFTLKIWMSKIEGNEHLSNASLRHLVFQCIQCITHHYFMTKFWPMGCRWCTRYFRMVSLKETGMLSRCSFLPPAGQDVTVGVEEPLWSSYRIKATCWRWQAAFPILDHGLEEKLWSCLSHIFVSLLQQCRLYIILLDCYTIGESYCLNQFIFGCLCSKNLVCSLTEIVILLFMLVDGVSEVTWKKIRS